MNSLKLKRVMYHSGALIGPDVHKVLQPESIQKFGDIFSPFDCDTKAGMQTFGSVNLVNKVKDLLTKFANCYHLYTKNAPLCRHEVEQLCLNCMEYGSWFTQQFPDATLKPKFHMLVVEMPRQVRRLRSIGMLTEEVSESIHPYINKLERMFASTCDVAERQKLTMRQHNLLSGVWEIKGSRSDFSSILNFRQIGSFGPFSPDVKELGCMCQWQCKCCIQLSTWQLKQIWTIFSRCGRTGMYVSVTV